MLYETLSDWQYVIDSPRLSACLSKNNGLHIKHLYCQWRIGPRPSLLILILGILGNLR